MKLNTKAILARANAATLGEWVCHLGQPDDKPADTCRCRSLLAGDYQGAIGEVFVDNGRRISDGGNDCPPEAEARANARFIAAARADVPALCSEVERLRDALRDFVDYERKRHPPRMGGDEYPPSLKPLMLAARALLEGE